VRGAEVRLAEGENNINDFSLSISVVLLVMMSIEHPKIFRMFVSPPSGWYYQFHQNTVQALVGAWSHPASCLMGQILQEGERERKKRGKRGSLTTVAI
jgi:hypothetical protein